MANFSKSSNPFTVLLFANLSTTILLLFTCIIINASLSNALSFSFPDFSSTSNIAMERAFARDRAIILAQDDNANIGRATYAFPMQLWDNATGRVTDFETRFTFVIDSNKRTSYGDGLAFFLAREGFALNSSAITKGSSFGLLPDDQSLDASKENSFVAVEFDIYQNPYDPVDEHVGIDINSVRSVANVTWLCNVTEGKVNEALISYNSTTQELSVNFTGFRSNVNVWQFLSYTVDFKTLLPEKVTFGFSAATGNQSALHSLKSWEFRSTLEVSAPTTPAAPGPSSDTLAPSPGRRGKNKVGLALGLGIGGFGLVCGLCLVFWFGRWRKRKGENSEEITQTMDSYLDDEFLKGTGPKKYSYNELVKATNNFKDDAKLGQGGFGGVYKGFLTDLNAYVAVKRVTKGSSQGVKEYAAEVKIISQLRHRNLVQLIGWCHDKGDLLLVYEYMPNGSLDSHLFKEKYKLLSWEDRYKIAQGLASALLYLHEEWEQCVVHRDIKSSNVMLDSNFNAKLGDFGLATLMDHSKGSQTITNVAGTPGYMAPEYFTTYKASKETDTYSFGIVALELACGRKPFDPKVPEDQVDIVRWVWSLYGRGKLLEAADPRLNGSDFDAQQMERLMVVGLWCAHPDYSLRPSMSQVIQVLGLNIQLPSLPPQMPVPTYVMPSTIHMTVSTTTVSCGTSNYSQGQSSCGFDTNSSLVTGSSLSAVSSPSRSLLHSS